LTLELTPTPKLIDTVREAHPDLSIVGFKVETEGDEETLVERARETMDRANLSFVVGNRADVMGETETKALVIRQGGTDEYAGSKAGLGVRVAQELATEL
jgi:phosphopantothenoylcysteine decarboxylase/phosphopantothenate--cysteine ligase